MDHIPCGLPANASEELAIQTLLDRLRSLSLAQRWILLTNLAHSVDSRGTPEEIDTLAIGSTGVQVIEVKHWGRGYLKSNSLTAEAEAEKLNNKVRKIVSKKRAPHEQT
ncbi:MAG: nuclease-related domain-containing protein [Thermoguttaceae bacterium]